MIAENVAKEARPIRQRSLKQGFVGWSSLHSALECTVRDIGETGAKLEFKDVTTLPANFELTIPVDGSIQPCRVVRMQGKTAGVEFTGPARESKKHKRDQVLSAYRVDENTVMIRSTSRAPVNAEDNNIRSISRPRQPAFGKLGK